MPAPRVRGQHADLVGHLAAQQVGGHVEAAAPEVLAVGVAHLRPDGHSAPCGLLADRRIVASSPAW